MLNSLIKWHAAARRLTGTLMDGEWGGGSDDDEGRLV